MKLLFFCVLILSIVGLLIPLTSCINVNVHVSSNSAAHQVSNRLHKRVPTPPIHSNPINIVNEEINEASLDEATTLPSDKVWRPLPFSGAETTYLEYLRKQQGEDLALGKVPFGYYKPINADRDSAPIPCGPGTYAIGKGNIRCKPCSRNFYTQQKGQSACRMCQPGFMTLREGSDRCIPIPRPNIDDSATNRHTNTNHGNNGKVGKMKVEDIKPGSKVWKPRELSGAESTYLEILRQHQGEDLAIGVVPFGYYKPHLPPDSKVMPCPVGTYSSGKGNSRCTPCSRNFYNHQLGQSSCRICEQGFMTLREGSDRCIPIPIPDID